MRLGRLLSKFPHKILMTTVLDTAGNHLDIFDNSMIDTSILTCMVYEYTYHVATKHLTVTIEV